MHPLVFQLFNLVFIGTAIFYPSMTKQLNFVSCAAFMQNVMLFIFAIPVQMAAIQQPEALGTSDYVLAALALLDIAMEFMADNQQYSFQTFKHSGVLAKNEWPGARIRWTQADAKRGFVTHGLWAWSRHPNFFCEQTFWVRRFPASYPGLSQRHPQVIINLFPLLAPESPKLPALPLDSVTPLWPLLPTLTVCGLFFSSTRFTESISVSKYPEAYQAYQQRVSMFVPFLTPVWGLLLSMRGKKAEVDKLVFGQELSEKKDQ